MIYDVDAHVVSTCASVRASQKVSWNDILERNGKEMEGILSNTPVFHSVLD